MSEELFKPRSDDTTSPRRRPTSATLKHVSSAVAGFQKIDYSTRPESASGRVILHPTCGIRSVHVYTDDGKEVFDLTTRIEVSWLDPRFKNWPLSAPVPKETWRPHCLCIGSSQLVAGADTAKLVVEEADTGMIQLAWTGKVKGETLPFDEKRLKRFPFDRVVLSLFVCMLCWPIESHLS